MKLLPIVCRFDSSYDRIRLRMGQVEIYTPIGKNLLRLGTSCKRVVSLFLLRYLIILFSVSSFSEKQLSKFEGGGVGNRNLVDGGWLSLTKKYRAQSTHKLTSTHRVILDRLFSMYKVWLLQAISQFKQSISYKINN